MPVCAITCSSIFCHHLVNGSINQSTKTGCVGTRSTRQEPATAVSNTVYSVAATLPAEWFSAVGRQCGFSSFSRAAARRYTTKHSNSVGLADIL